MKKTILIILIFLYALFGQVYADGVDDVLDEQMRENIDNSFENADVEFDASNIIDKLNDGNFNIDYKNFGEYIKVNFIKEFKESFGFIAHIFILVLLSALIENVHTTFKNDRLVKLVVSGIVVLNLVSVTDNIAQYTVQVIDRLILFINSLIPTLMTLLAASGKIGTSGVLNPIMLGVSSIISMIIKSLAVPLCLISLVLKLTGNITEKNHLVNFGNQIQKVLKWVLGIVFTVYVGIISIVGVTAPKIDDITLKTTKYAVSNFIPYVGGVAADSVDLILACSSVVKNSVGIAGLIGIFLIIAVPCIKIAVKVICVNILSMMMSPISNKAIIDSFNSVCSSLSLLLGMNIIISIMYIISITVIIFIGGA